MKFWHVVVRTDTERRFARSLNLQRYTELTQYPENAAAFRSAAAAERVAGHLRREFPLARVRVEAV